MYIYLSKGIEKGISPHRFVNSFCTFCKIGSVQIICQIACTFRDHFAASPMEIINHVNVCNFKESLMFI